MKRIKKYYRIVFELTSPLSVGSGENNVTDRDILRDGRGVPYIPGTALAGVYRSLFSEGTAEEYFGPELTEEKIRDGLEHIYQVKGNTYEAAVAMAGALYSLLAVFMHYGEKENQEKDIQSTYVEKAEKYIETNYSYPVTVEDVAAYVGISRSHLFRSFQTYMGKSPKEFLSEYRIKQACHLLKETDLSVSAIAYSVGFENNLYFSKAFKKHKGVSPSEYRKDRKTQLSFKKDSLSNY